MQELAQLPGQEGGGGGGGSGRGGETSPRADERARGRDWHHDQVETPSQPKPNPATNAYPLTPRPNTAANYEQV